MTIATSSVTDWSPSGGIEGRKAGRGVLARRQISERTERVALKTDVPEVGFDGEVGEAGESRVGEELVPRLKRERGEEGEGGGVRSRSTSKVSLYASADEQQSSSRVL